MGADRITALEQALEPFALISSEGVVKAGSTGHVTITTVAEYFHEAAYALAASRAAPDCHQPDLVTAAQVRVKPLVWRPDLFSIQMATAQPGWAYVVGIHEKNKTWHWWRDGRAHIVSTPFGNVDAAKAAAQANYEARIFSALDLTPAPAVEPVAMTAQDAARVPEIAAAFEAGAMAVHREWLRAHENGEGPPRGEPDFSEAASDYAALRAIGGDA